MSNETGASMTTRDTTHAPGWTTHWWPGSGYTAHGPPRRTLEEARADFRTPPADVSARSGAVLAEAVRTIEQIRNVMDHAPGNRDMLARKIMAVLDSTEIGCIGWEAPAVPEPACAPSDAAQQVAAERERCARHCEVLARMLESGAGDPPPGSRLRQAARNIRDGKPCTLWDMPGCAEEPAPCHVDKSVPCDHCAGTGRVFPRLQASAATTVPTCPKHPGADLCCSECGPVPPHRKQCLVTYENESGSQSCCRHDEGHGGGHEDWAGGWNGTAPQCAPAKCAPSHVDTVEVSGSPADRQTWEEPDGAADAHQAATGCTLEPEEHRHQSCRIAPTQRRERDQHEQTAKEERTALRSEAACAAVSPVEGRASPPMAEDARGAAHVVHGGPAADAARAPDAVATDSNAGTTRLPPGTDATRFRDGPRADVPVVAGPEAGAAVGAVDAMAGYIETLRVVHRMIGGGYFELARETLESAIKLAEAFPEEAAPFTREAEK